MWWGRIPGSNFATSGMQEFSSSFFFWVVVFLFLFLFFSKSKADCELCPMMGVSVSTGVPQNVVGSSGVQNLGLGLGSSSHWTHWPITVIEWYLEVPLHIASLPDLGAGRDSQDHLSWDLRSPSCVALKTCLPLGLASSLPHPNWHTTHPSASVMLL